ncbi:MAG TPA: heme-binding protein [Actinomycetota bacterium]|nr:heme-binding protein [Actinomycetota bacterium]
MADDLVSHSAGFTRFGRDAQTAADELGPLAHLVGTWIGSRGWEVIAVPKPSSGGHDAFDAIIEPYVETVTFVPIGAPVPDRGGDAGNLFLTGLKYEMRIAALDTNEPLHLENGMWFYMEGEDHPIARSSAIPHGDCLLALGSYDVSPSAPAIPAGVSSAPDGQPPNVPFGYADPFDPDPDAPFNPADVNGTLIKTLAGLNVVETTTLQVSTTNGGGILNIPFVTAHANATCFDSTYWIETVEDAKTGQRFQQLQYSQRTDIEFFQNAEKPEQLIKWPHVNVNTWRKQ